MQSATSPSDTDRLSVGHAAAACVGRTSNAAAKAITGQTCRLRSITTPIISEAFDLL